MTLKNIKEFLQNNQGYLKWGDVRIALKLDADLELVTQAKSEVKSSLITEEVKAKPTILVLDIETAPMISYTWGMWDQNIGLDQLEQDWFILCWSAKDITTGKIYSQVINPVDVVNEDDSHIVKELWDLLENIDVIVGHNCVEINTPILKQDLTWEKAGNLKIGDKLVGFEEKVIPGTTVRNKDNKWIGGKNRKIKPTEVTNLEIKSEPCVEIEFDNGDKIITTKDHYWLGMAENDNNQRWYKSENLRIGQRIKKFMNVWEKDFSYEAGWLSGFIAGEGCLNQTGAGFTVQFYQRPGVTWNQALEYCEKLNMTTSKDRKIHHSGIGKQDTLSTSFLGGKYKNLENIGRLQIKRFIDKIDWNNFGGLFSKNNPPAKIINIKNVGNKKVAVFSTTEKTFFGAGYPMHNCDRFDIKKINSKFIEHGLGPTKPYRTIDTLKVARKNFSFSSNKLEALARKFGFESKNSTDFNLWKACMKGDKEALIRMSLYCDQDVLITEKVFMKLLPWIKDLNIGVYNIDDEIRCPACGSNHLKEAGFHYTSISKYQAYRCKECGHISRDRHSILTRDENKNIIVSVK